MNQEDRAAWPMYNAFTNTPNDTPYTYAPNQIPLTQGLTSSASATAPSFAPATPSQLKVPASERAIYEQWVVWSHNGRFNRRGAIQD